MESPANSNSAPSNFPKLDEQLTFGVLKSQARRKLLVAFAAGGPQAGADLKEAGRGFGYSKHGKAFTKSTLAHLRKMVAAGIVLKVDHGTDGRRVLYSLSPAVKVSKEGLDTIFDFGFVIVQLSADGN